MKAEEIKQLPIFFIVGMGRSGTTLLRTMLDAGEETIAPPESKIIILLKQKYNHKKIWSEQLIDEFISDLFNIKNFPQIWKIDKEELRSKINSYSISDINFPFICKLIYLSYSSLYKKGEIKIICDKNPIYSIFIEELLEIFPNAKFIHIVRDYRDCIYSNQQYFKRKNAAVLSVTWGIYNSWISHFKRKYSKQIYLIRYEDLVMLPEEYLSEICEFLKITYTPKMLTYYKELQNKENDFYSKEIEKMHSKLLNEVNTSSVNKWNENLAKDDLEIISYILNDYGQKFQYVPQPIQKKFQVQLLFAIGVNIKDLIIIKGYHLLPFVIRNFIKSITDFLFYRFGYKSFYNYSDHRVILKNDN